MAKPEWGTKRMCQACGARFYDLARDPIVCPKCGEEQDPLANVRQTRSRAAPEPKAPAKKKAVPKVEEAADEDEVEVSEEDDLDTVEDEDDDLIEDASELGEDDEVIEALDDEDDDKNT